MSLADKYEQAKKDTDTRIPSVTEGDGYPVTLADFERKLSDAKKDDMFVLHFKVLPISKEDKKAFGDVKGKIAKKYYVMTNPYAEKGMYAFLKANGANLSEMDNNDDIEDFFDNLDFKPKGRMYYEKLALKGADGKPNGQYEQYPSTLTLFDFDKKGKVAVKAKAEPEAEEDEGPQAPD